MNVAVVIVGINQWDEYTKPLICDLDICGKGAKIIVVDNASEPPYPHKDGVTIVRTERVCYSKAINTAVWRAGRPDWILSMNNDVSCYAEFIPLLYSLEPNAVYSRQIITEAGYTWFGNWIVAIPFNVWSVVGQFDESFRVCGFEDCDYSMRAMEHGFPTKHADLPFIHHWGKTRWDIPGYPATREENIRYFASKWGWTPGQNMVVTHD